MNCENQTALAKIAAEIGVELFVMDDGWFGKRNNDRAGLGDWFVNREKFPNGLDGLINQVNALGMDFGIWVEPEMVNADSDLFRTHPDWTYHYDTREACELRNQRVLNMTRTSRVLRSEELRASITSLVHLILRSKGAIPSSPKRKENRRSLNYADSLT